jgi:hypothetical protein
MPCPSLRLSHHTTQSACTRMSISISSSVPKQNCSTSLVKPRHYTNSSRISWRRAIPHFATAVQADPTIPASFTQACRDYLATLALDGTPLFIESGVQGTFPLFLLSLTDNIGEMVFYTTTPWLYPIYEPIVFRKNYNYLREMETIVAHDYLFQLKTMQDDKVLVEETTNERARHLALYEIQTFKAMLIRSMHTVTP